MSEIHIYGALLTAIASRKSTLGCFQLFHCERNFRWRCMRGKADVRLCDKILRNQPLTPQERKAASRMTSCYKMDIKYEDCVFYCSPRSRVQHDTPSTMLPYLYATDFTPRPTAPLPNAARHMADDWTALCDRLKGHIYVVGNTAFDTYHEMLALVRPDIDAMTDETQMALAISRGTWLFVFYVSSISKDGVTVVNSMFTLVDHTDTHLRILTGHIDGHIHSSASYIYMPDGTLVEEKEPDDVRKHSSDEGYADSEDAESYLATCSQFYSEVYAAERMLDIVADSGMRLGPARTLTRGMNKYVNVNTFPLYFYD